MTERDWSNPDIIPFRNSEDALVRVTPAHNVRGDFWSEPWSFSESEVMLAGRVGVRVNDTAEQLRLMTAMQCDIPAGATVEQLVIKSEPGSLWVEAIYDTNLSQP